MEYLAACAAAVPPLAPRAQFVAALATESVNISHAGLRAADAAAVAAALAVNRHVQAVCMAHNSIGDDGAAAVCASLFMNGTVAVLDVSDNGLTPAAAEPLAALVERNSRVLQCLRVAENRLGDRGVGRLALEVNSNQTNQNCSRGRREPTHATGVGRCDARRAGHQQQQADATGG